MSKKLLNISITLSSILFIGCGGGSSNQDTTPIITPTPTPTSISVPLKDEQKEIRAVSSMVLNGVNYNNLSFNTILKTGYQDSNGEIFGALKDVNGNLIKNEDGSNFICKSSNQGSGPDHTSIIDKDNKIYMVTQFECGIGAIYMGELEQNSGVLSFKKGTLKYIDQSSEFGGWVHCAGMKTPWNSHLSSEEYEPDAKSQVDKNGKLTASEYGSFLSKYWAGEYPNPYYYGWIPEVKIEQSNYSYTKHYSMGRFAHELAYVMPDKKTVYLSDDGTNVGFYMFIADREEDLSSGTLYGAKWNQTSSENSGSANLSWINLGHTSDSAVRAVVATKPNFTDFFEVGSLNDDNITCKSGFTSINTANSQECLKIKAGVDEAILSRVETRRYSAIKGVTTEFRKEEGITYDRDHNRLYIAMSRIQYGMEDNAKLGKKNTSYDIGGHNDVKVPYNNCGAVYSSDMGSNISDSSGKLINSNYVAKNMYGLISGEMKKYDENSSYAGNSCDVDKIAEPDNISYITGTNILLIGEDGSYHKNNMGWSYNVQTKELNRILTAPIGAEATSIFWQNDINGYSYITAVIQHPFGELESSDVNYNINADSSVGYIGAFKGLK